MSELPQPDEIESIDVITPEDDGAMTLIKVLYSHLNTTNQYLLGLERADLQYRSNETLLEYILRWIEATETQSPTKVIVKRKAVAEPMNFGPLL